jgi:hypothetical protein
MEFIIDYATRSGAMDIIRFAIEECDNRMLEAHAAGQPRTRMAWKLTKEQYEKTLNELVNTPTNSIGYH